MTIALGRRSIGSRAPSKPVGNTGQCLRRRKRAGKVTMKRLMHFVGEENGVAIQVFADREKALQWLAEPA